VKPHHLSQRLVPRLGWALPLLVTLALGAGYWWLPIRGQVYVLWGRSPATVGAWPHVWVDPQVVAPSEPFTVYVQDSAPWSHVKLLVDGLEMQRDKAYTSGTGPWTWRWRIPATSENAPSIEFYHSCHTGCIKRAAVTVGTVPRVERAAEPAQATKLGVVFADAARDWHGRTGWTVELTYAEQQADVDFSIDGLARRAYMARRKGLRVLARIAYDRQQALPPADDEVALAKFLAYCQRLARDERLSDVYAYVIGTGYNAAGENALALDRPTTPEWYARVFNGYGLAPTRADNVVQSMRSIDPTVRILVGPVAPWNSDQNGALADPDDVPWLNYFNTLVAHMDAATRARQDIGIPLTAPDGFALRAAGRVSASAAEGPGANEPSRNVYRAQWGTAQAGFRVYRDWLSIINRYSTTRGLPAFITSTNVFSDDAQAPPAQLYPSGWLTAALTENEGEPQIQALCWFVDEPLGNLWTNYSLGEPTGRMHNAADEFDRLLQH